MRCMAVDEDGAFFGTPVESCGFHLSNRNFVGSVVHIQEEVYQDRQEVEVQAQCLCVEDREVKTPVETVLLLCSLMGGIR